jgi:hypothetical protein
VAEHEAMLARAQAGELLLAPRDASWFNYPATASGPRSHAGGRYHVATYGGTAACWPVLLVMELAVPARDADTALVCRRQPCAGAWARHAALRDALRRERAVQAGWAFGVP